MGFTYSAPRHTQHILPGLVIAGVLAASLLPGAEPAWAGLVGALPDWVIFGVGLWLVHKVAFWGCMALFTVVDHTDKPAFIARHRIQDGTPRLPPTSRVLRVLALNQLLLAPLCLAGMYGFLKLRGWSMETEFPSFLRFALEISGMGVASVCFFYASHRFLHRPWWMKKVHRVHHEFRTSRTWASEYAHPIEFTVGNFGTLAIGVFLLSPHMLTMLVYTFVAMLQVLVHHAGYALPWAPWAVHHDWHHYRYKEAFGTIGILDRLLGTSPELDAMNEGDRR